MRKQIISDELGEILISLNDHDEYVKAKMEMLISLLNVGYAINTPYELFLLGKTLGSLLSIQIESSVYDITEQEIVHTISELEEFLKKIY